jgi:ABC-type glycerol-3-phosphate transport system substrate-binding protein
MRSTGLVTLTLLLSFTMLAGSAPVTLRVQDPARGEWLTDILKESVPLFEAKNPDIKIELDQSCLWGECQQKNVVMAAAGTLPDILFVYHEARTGYIRAGLLMDITKRMQAEPSVAEAWLAPLREAPKYEGRYYGVPEFWVPYLAHVNLTAFDESGLGDPAGIYQSNGWTLQNLANIVPKLVKRTAGDAAIERYGMTILGGWVGMLPWAWGYGADPFSADALEVRLDTQEARAGYTALNRLLNEVEGTILDGAASQGRWGIALWNLCIWHIVKAWKLPGDFDVLPMPTGPAGPVNQAMTARTWGIASSTKHPDAAWRFLKHLGGVEHDSILVNQRQTLPLTVRNTPLSIQVHREQLRSRYISTALDVLVSKGRMFPYPLDMSVVNELNTQLKPIWNREKSVDAALTQAQQVISAKINTLRATSN